MHMRTRIQEQQKETSPSHRQAKTFGATFFILTIQEEGFLHFGSYSFQSFLFRDIFLRLICVYLN